MEYNTAFYNVIRGDEQRIRLGEGCPNGCSYCYAPKELISYDIPDIKKNRVSIMDMNFLYNPAHKERIIELGNKRVGGKVVYYELICGIDFRLLDLETAKILKANRFRNIRFAWDYGLELQYKLKDCYSKLIKTGYKANELTVFMLCDWKISFNECLLKLGLLKIWGVGVSDCWYDNVKPPNYQGNNWTMEECKLFRGLCGIHNQSIRFQIYPDLPRAKRVFFLLNNLKCQRKLF